MDERCGMCLARAPVISVGPVPPGLPAFLCDECRHEWHKFPASRFYREWASGLISTPDMVRKRRINRLKHG